MKKSIVLSVAVAALVGISSSCYAGFGIPGVPKAPKAEKPAATASASNQSATVDLSDITNNQAQVLKYMLGGLYAQARSYQVIQEAMGVADPELAQTVASLKGGKSSDAKKANNILKKKSTETMAAVQSATVKKAEVQVQKLAEAIKTGKAYQQAAIVNYGFVAANAPKALKEATGALKGIGSNPVAAGKVNGAMNTYKLGIEISGAAQKVSGEYDKMVDALKADWGVTQEALDAAKSPDVQAVATDCMNFIEGK